jgi:tetratricopeptide (TPR) repeat protein
MHRATELDQARECVLAAEEAGDKKARRALAECGVRHARAAVVEERVDGHYYLGWSLWLSASTYTFVAYKMFPQARDEALVAVKLDRRIDHAGPVRLLGRIYSEAPPWPASIGDNEHAIALLQEAVKLAPEDPENHLLLANAFKNDARVADARREYRVVLDAAPAGEFARQLPRWQDEAHRKLP